MVFFYHFSPSSFPLGFFLHFFHDALIIFYLFGRGTGEFIVGSFPLFFSLVFRVHLSCLLFVLRVRLLVNQRLLCEHCLVLLLGLYSLCTFFVSLQCYQNNRIVEWFAYIYLARSQFHQGLNHSLHYTSGLRGTYGAYAFVISQYH